MRLLRFSLPSWHPLSSPLESEQHLGVHSALQSELELPHHWRWGWHQLPALPSTMPALSCSLFARQCRLGMHHQRCRRWCLTLPEVDRWRCPRDHSSEWLRVQSSHIHPLWLSHLTYRGKQPRCSILNPDHTFQTCLKWGGGLHSMAKNVPWLAKSFKSSKSKNVLWKSPASGRQWIVESLSVRLASLTSPLNSKSFFTISRWPICAAMNKGVASSSVCEFGTAPKAKSASAICRWPRHNFLSALVQTYSNDFKCFEMFGAGYCRATQGNIFAHHSL